MKQEELLLLLKEGENSRIEFKERINIKGEKAKEEFVKDLMAMANTSPGDGYIVYGVTETGGIVGIQRDKRLEESLQQIASSRSHPPVNFSCKWVTISNKCVFIICIPESQIRPHATSRKDVYIRRQHVIDKAAPIEIHQMILRRRFGLTQHSELSESVQKSLTEDSFISQFPQYDRNYFPLLGSPQAYRTCQKQGRLDSPAICSVFMPHFGIFVPEPEFGDTRSVISFEWHTGRHIIIDRKIFYAFLRSLEARIYSFASSAGIWNCWPISWSLSRSQEMDYGLGADNACLALDMHVEKALLGGIIQFERVNVYKPTNFLTFIAEIFPEKGKFYLRTLALKLMLSSIPLSQDWVNKLFETLEILQHNLQGSKPGDNALNEALCTLHWSPTGNKDTFEPKVLGLFGRDAGSSPQYDLGLGVVIDTDSIPKTRFEIDRDDSWNRQWYESVFKKPPVYCFQEFPIQITNPIPTREAISTKDFTIRVPTMRQVIIGLSGLILVALNAHSFPAR